MASETKTSKKKKRPPPKKTSGIDLSKDIPGADDGKYVKKLSKKLTKKQIIERTSKAYSKAINEENEGEAPTGYEWMRKMAEVIYVTATTDMSIRQLSEMPEFKDKVAFKTLTRYSAEDKWQEKRRDYIEQLSNQIRQRVATSQVEARITQLEQFQGIFDRLLAAMPTALPKSLEGVAMATVRVGKSIEELRSTIAAEILPEQGANLLQSEAPVQPVLTHEEARAAATAVVEVRKEAAKVENQRLSENTEDK